MKYFAYGSNMNPERMRQRGIKFFKRERAILENWKLEFNKISSRSSDEGYANIIPMEGHVVEGILYEICDSDMERLDEYEGYPKHYDRVKINVKLNDGREVEAMAYIAQRDKTRNGLKPSKEYLDHLMKGSDLLSRGYREMLRNLRALDR